MRHTSKESFWIFLFVQNDRFQLKVLEVLEASPQ